MPDSWDQPWSDNPHAPHIMKYEYIAEKATLAGSFIGSILYGVVTVLFFRCMAALRNPVYRRDEGIKWWLVSYTVTMFSFVTVYTAMNLQIQSNSFIDNRQDIKGWSTPLSGPLKYQYNIRSAVLGLIPSIMFNLNNWLADGLLIYRCYIIYCTNLWVIVLPCLLYLASFGVGIVILNFQRLGYVNFAPLYPRFGIPHLSISASLNVLLTLMIVIRLVLHGRKIRTATGSPAEISRLQAVSTILIESCALFTVSSLVVVGALVRAGSSGNPHVFFPGSYVVDIFFPVLTQIQAIAPLLVIQRVVNRSALTSRAITAGQASSFSVMRQGEDYPQNPAAGYGKNPGELGVVVQTTADFHPDDKV